VGSAATPKVAAFGVSGGGNEYGVRTGAGDAPGTDTEESLNRRALHVELFGESISVSSAPARATPWVLARRSLAK